MFELVRNHEDIYIIVYCLLILWMNISFIKVYKNVKKGLSDVTSEDELLISPESLSLIIIGLLFSFFRRWLIYFLAILISEQNIVIIIISLILFVVDLYNNIFNYSLKKVSGSNINLYLAVVDTIYISLFVTYLIFNFFN